MNLLFHKISILAGVQCILDCWDSTFLFPISDFRGCSNGMKKLNPPTPTLLADSGRHSVSRLSSCRYSRCSWGSSFGNNSVDSMKLVFVPRRGVGWYQHQLTSDIFLVVSFDLFLKAEILPGYFCLSLPVNCFYSQLRILEEV